MVYYDDSTRTHTITNNIGNIQIQNKNVQNVFRRSKDGPTFGDAERNMLMLLIFACFFLIGLSKQIHHKHDNLMLEN